MESMEEFEQRRQFPNCLRADDFCASCCCWLTFLYHNIVLMAIANDHNIYLNGYWNIFLAAMTYVRAEVGYEQNFKPVGLKRSLNHKYVYLLVRLSPTLITINSCFYTLFKIHFFPVPLQILFVWKKSYSSRGANFDLFFVLYD